MRGRLETLRLIGSVAFACSVFSNGACRLADLDCAAADAACRPELSLLRQVSPAAGGAVGDITGTGVWARSSSVAPNANDLSAVAVDSLGYAYMGGSQFGNGSFTYGTQSVSGAATAAINVVLGRFDPDGQTVWLLSNTTGTNSAGIRALAVDSSGNIYAAGFQSSTATYTYGGLPIAGAVGNNNALLLKLNSAGSVIWARTTSTGLGAVQFLAVATDAAGNIYCAGTQGLATTNTYNGAAATSTFAGGTNVLLVKYDSTGNGVWARSTTVGANASGYNGVAVDQLGNVYAAGFQTGTSNYDYGGGQTATGVNAGTNALLVKYNSAGVTQWARTTSVGTGASQFLGLSKDPSGNVFAVGSQAGTAALTYSPQSVAGAFAGGNNAVAVKYDGNGNALWARSVSTAANASAFNAAAADGQGNFYAGGIQTGSAAYSFGSLSATGPNAGANANLIKYNSAGSEVWLRSTTVGTNVSVTNALAVLNTDFLFTAGSQTGSGASTFGGLLATGASVGLNVRINKFR